MTETKPMRTKRRKQPRLHEIRLQLRKNKLAVVSLFVLIALFLIAVFAPLIAPYSYDEQNVLNSYAKPSAEHLLGTDKMGRDIFSRLIYGTRQSLQMGILSVLLGAFIGITIGSISGYYGTWVDNLLMRFLDIYQAIPMFLLCVALAAILGPSLRNAIIALGLGIVPGYARIMRASVMTVRDTEYIESAKSINCGTFRIIMKHIIPNAIGPMIVQITMGIGSCILAGAALSFIGLGVQPPVPEWGTMISEARSVMRQYPTHALYPGICIMISVLACNLLGDGLRDALDPRLKS
ncbi:MAG: ABC transporter permease [Clostridiales bacterium]|jgi:peptide/nickel transport system permease protein|nr:ABC transporter permease [Clostridiales bacterium]